MSFPTDIEYRGRFAPSPTGPLHFGSLVAALASYLDAQYHRGKWLVRIDDLDHQRCKPEYSQLILQTLERFCLEWDEAIVFQHEHLATYDAYLQQLRDKNLTYYCQCSRKILPKGAYKGTCRHRQLQAQALYSTRLKTSRGTIDVNDLIQENFQQDLAQDIGDFVIFRADQMHSYHLATVVDDYLAGITHIIRGSDLLDSTPRQIYLQELLGFTKPIYAHIPIAINSQGEKLSKQTYAKPIEDDNRQEILLAALIFLGQSPPAKIKKEPLQKILQWAIEHWQLALIPRKLSKTQQ